jgi:DNA-3-methyladenine glycosylase
VAPDLLGMRLHSAIAGVECTATIVETEAYLGREDRASHARAGLTARTRPMFGPPGRAYVYLVYGMHWCFNVVTENDGTPGAVLVRAVAPEDRGAAGRAGAGPALVCRLLGIDGTHDGADLTGGPPLWLEDAGPAGDDRRDIRVVCGPRVGVGYAGEPWASLPYRFGVAGHPALSRPFPA